MLGQTTGSAARLRLDPVCGMIIFSSEQSLKESLGNLPSLERKPKG
jgi:hypothetical protein